MSERPHGEPPHLRPAAFLDRDGTIHEDVHFLSRPEDLRLLPGAADAIAAFRGAGYAIVCATNQSGIARGIIDEARLAEIHDALRAMLLEANPRAVIDAFYHCPHHPEGTLERYAIRCDCRKPAPGLLLRARDDLGLDLARSFIVGDKERDLEAGRRAGLARGYLIAPGGWRAVHGAVLGSSGSGP